MRSQNPQTIENLINELAKLPTIGRKSAERLAYKIVDMEKEDVFSLINAIKETKENIKRCPICGNITDIQICSICSDQSRDKTMVMIVEDAKSISNLEKVGKYNGLYYIYGEIKTSDMGSVSDDRIKALEKRFLNSGVKEVIIAFSPTFEADSVSFLITNILKKYNIVISRIARGIPMGVNLDYFDENAFFSAVEERRRID